MTATTPTPHELDQIRRRTAPDGRPIVTLPRTRLLELTTTNAAKTITLRG